jgi:hypothetical protein
MLECGHELAQEWDVLYRICSNGHAVLGSMERQEKQALRKAVVEKQREEDATVRAAGLSHKLMDRLKTRRFAQIFQYLDQVLSRLAGRRFLMFRDLTLMNIYNKKYTAGTWICFCSGKQTEAAHDSLSLMVPCALYMPLPDFLCVGNINNCGLDSDFSTWPLHRHSCFALFLPMRFRVVCALHPMQNSLSRGAHHLRCCDTSC